MVLIRRYNGGTATLMRLPSARMLLMPAEPAALLSPIVAAVRVGTSVSNSALDAGRIGAKRVALVVKPGIHEWTRRARQPDLPIVPL